MKKLFAFLMFAACLFAASTTWAVNGLDNTPIGPNVPSTGKFTDLEASGLDSTPVGENTPSTGKFTNLEATGTLTLGGETATNISGIDGKNTKVSSDDTTAGFLNGKLVPGNGITLTENSGGGNETLSISTNDKLTTKGDVLTHDGTNETRLPVGATGQVLVVDPAVANGVKWGNINTIDEDDEVEITFTRKFEYDPGTGAVNAIDINGTDLVISQTNPTVTLGGVARTVLATENLTLPMQRVIIDLPVTLTEGNYKIKLTNTQGNSEAFIPLDQIFDPYTKLLLHGDGVGSTFVDSSGSAHSPINPIGDATQSATESKIGDKSMYFDGSGDYLNIADSDDWSFGSGDFTVEAWVNFAAHPASNGNVLAIAGQFSGTQKSWRLGYYNNAGTYRLWWNTSTNGSNETDFKPAWTATLNSWHHIAITRKAGTVRAFVDGSQISSQADTATYFSSSSDLYIGKDQVVSGYDMNGYIDELRISKGIARWTEAFDPATVPYN